ncbi:MAG: putative hemagglutinin/hemolysin-related protein [Parcubacteria bacterium C7867-001]|nr:MAG: putative hemagglutinin/hemolysin-related protein [Parcubacteria bacterium C7867-001]
MTTKPRGFIALISAVVISTILLGLATTLANTTFFSRFDVLNSEYKRISLGLAEACVHSALSKIGVDYNYVAPVGGETVTLGTAYGSATSCAILGPTVTPMAVNGKRTYTITTKAGFRGAWSTLSVSATAQDPAVAAVTPPPNCALIASPTSLPFGQNLTLLWSTSGGATSASIDHGVGSISPLSSGSYTFNPGVSPGTVTFTMTATNAGGSNTCSATVTVTAPPPAPSCADTAMVFDRTGSMSGTDLNNERSAGNALINLYAGVAALPKIAVGSFGGLDGSPASIPTNGQLSNFYSTLSSTLTSITGSNSSVGSNLGAAVNVADTELASARHDSAKSKVLIFVSDGLPNEPSGSSPLNSGWRAPSANAAGSSGNAWTNPAGAYGAGVVSDSGAHTHQYFTFGFGSIPSNATITNVEVQTRASSSPAIVANTGFLLPSATKSPNNWSNATNAFTFQNGSYATETNENDEQGYGSFNLPTIPSGATILGIEVEARAKSSDTNGCQLQTRLSWNNGSSNTSTKTTNLSGSDTTYTLGSASDTWGHTWSASEFTNTNFVAKVSFDDASGGNCSGSTVSLDHIRVRVTYQQSGSCQLGTAVSWNGGSSWTSEQTATLSTSMASTTFDNPWSGRTFTPSDFTDANFRVRVHELTSGPTCALDNVNARVSYTVPTDPSTFASTAATNARANGVNIFSIHFGDASGQNFLQSLSSPSTLPAISITSISRASNTVTVTTSIPHRVVVNERIVISGVTNAAYNGTFRVVSTPTPVTFTYSQSGSNGSSGGGSVTHTNLFIAPASSAMSGIFQSIGTQICPAAAAACANTVDDDGDGLIDAEDAGCHTDGDASNGASYSSSDNDEWSTPATPPAPPPPPPPPSISIGSWTEVP